MTDPQRDPKKPRPAADLLLQAIAATARRGRTYGPPAQHFDRTIKAARALMPDLFAREPTAADWAKLMIVDKLARDHERPILDTCLDVAGYAACLAEVRHWQDGWSEGTNPPEPTWTIGGLDAG